MNTSLLSVAMLALFADDASAFKQTFEAAGRSALKDTLRSLGLLAK